MNMDGTNISQKPRVKALIHARIDENLHKR